MTSFKEEFGEKLGLILSHLQCAVCLGTVNEPVTLPCGDTFCKECISQHKSVITKNKNQSSEDLPKNLCCPSCRVAVNSRTVMNENMPFKELANLACRTVDRWEQLTGKTFVAPKVCIPLSQAPVSSEAMGKPSVIRRGKGSLEKGPPPLSRFGSPDSIREEDANFLSPPVLSPACSPPKAEMGKGGKMAVSLSPPKPDATTGDGSERSSLPTSTTKGHTFAKPAKDPYEFKGSQSQSQDNNNDKQKNAVQLYDQQKSTETSSKKLEKPEKPARQVSVKQKENQKRKTKSGGNADGAVEALSSQNSAIMHMREIVRAAESYELAVEDESRRTETSDSVTNVAVPQKRVLSTDSDHTDEAGSGGKKQKKSANKAIAVEKNDDVLMKSSSAVSPPNKTNSAFSPLEFMSEPPNRVATSKESPQEVVTSSVVETVSASTGKTTNEPTRLNDLEKSQLRRPTSTKDISKNVQQSISKTKMSDASTETPAVSGFILIRPFGDTVMAALTKYQCDAAVQTDDLTNVSIPEPAPKILADSSAQTDHVSTSAMEIQTDEVVIEQPTIRKAHSITKVAFAEQAQINECGESKMDICTPGLLAAVANDEGSTYWSVPQDQEDVEMLEDTKRPESSPLPPSADTLCPDSLAVAAALCNADVETEDMADTVVGTSFGEGEIVNATPPVPAFDEGTVGDVVLPSPTTNDRGPTPPGPVTNDVAAVAVGNPNSVDVVASSVESFLRPDPSQVSKLQISCFDNKFSPVGLPNKTFSTTTPATEVAPQSENRSSLTNFMNRMSNQFGAALNAQSTPAASSLRRFTFAVNANATSPQNMAEALVAQQQTNDDSAALKKPSQQTLPTRAMPIPPMPSMLPMSQADLPQLLRDARIETSMISLTSSGCTGYEPYVNALRTFCDLFSCRQTGNFIVKSTTHVVIKTVPGHDPFRVCDRTMKFLLGVAARRWLVSIQWVIDSVREKRVLPEEQYEITGDTSTAADHCGPSKSRSSRVGLFDNFEICCAEDIGTQFFTREDVFQLIELCGGTRVDSPDAFSYRRGTKRIIAIAEPTTDSGQTIPPTADELKRRKDMHRRYKAVLLSVDWVLDSISRCARIDASQPTNAAYCLYPSPSSELASLAN